MRELLERPSHGLHANSLLCKTQRRRYRSKPQFWRRSASPVAFCRASFTYFTKSNELSLHLRNLDSLLVLRESPVEMVVLVLCPDYDRIAALWAVYCSLVHTGVAG